MKNSVYLNSLLLLLVGHVPHMKRHIEHKRCGRGALRLIHLHFHISPSESVISGMVLFTLGFCSFSIQRWAM
jgi:hypothetical protein